MTSEGSTDTQRLRGELEENGFAIRRSQVDAALVRRLAEAIDLALDGESKEFPEGDEQHGRLLFAPEYGGAFLEVLALDPLLNPIESILGHDMILFTMTSSVLFPGIPGPAREDHVDFPADRPSGLALAVTVILDEFTHESGGTIFKDGSHKAGYTGREVALIGQPGDVCYFDPRITHRSGLNQTNLPRRSLLIALVQPWMKQRFDVATILGGLDLTHVPGRVRRRLGLQSQAPASHAEFIKRRSDRPWS